MQELSELSDEELKKEMKNRLKKNKNDEKEWEKQKILSINRSNLRKKYLLLNRKHSYTDWESWYKNEIKNTQTN